MALVVSAGELAEGALRWLDGRAGDQSRGVLVDWDRAGPLEGPRQDYCPAPLTRAVTG